MNNQYTIRVYGIILSEENELLLTNEAYLGVNFTKFPGGGMEWNEGALDTIRRELKEELNLKNVAVEHFYTTDFFVPSFFDANTQVISIYYRVTNLLSKTDIKLRKKDKNLIEARWIKLDKLKESDVTFPIDKHVVKLLKRELTV